MLVLSVIMVDVAALSGTFAGMAVVIMICALGRRLARVVRGHG